MSAERSSATDRAAETDERVAGSDEADANGHDPPTAEQPAAAVAPTMPPPPVGPPTSTAPRTTPPDVPPPPVGPPSSVPGPDARPAPASKSRSVLQRRRMVRSRKVRRVIRHIDPWSVLTFSIIFNLCVFGALLLAGSLVWSAAEASGTIANVESFIRDLGDYDTWEIQGDAVLRAGVIIAGMMTLASTVLAVLLTVVFNLISDLIGGIRVTVIEEEVHRLAPEGRG